LNRKICVVTGTRAEYGLLYWVIESIRRTPGLDLQIIACGMHLAPEFGLTYREIEADGFHIDAKVDMLLSSDTPTGVAKSIGLGIIGFADAFARLEPDVVLVLGDRFEILCATQSAFVAGICVAHISGGEVTEGALDDSFRHCITKMARYHFVAADAYRRRVIQLGEQPDCVFNVGDPGLDNIARLPILDFAELCVSAGLHIAKPYFLVTFHPATSDGPKAEFGLQALIEALNEFPDYGVLLTKSNADAGGRALNDMIDAYAMSSPGRVVSVTSLGRLGYLSAMKHCAAVVGNSSSGIVEAPAMGVPTVNVGTRQQGRLKASSVIDCAEERTSIVEAITRALTPEFRRLAGTTRSLYGNCDASTLIARKLTTLAVERWSPKRFYDCPN
jgi:UDP-N-acetylglucosamine 2-epimerase (non-hydrolysing)/GDP/UDP-N,N'-diacetylbacillosamine 2-epimerase (hydrolysing)